MVLATVVGVLIEVPVMLSVVKIVNRTRVRYERKSGGPDLHRVLPCPLFVIWRLTYSGLHWLSIRENRLIF
jgi:hypothetical protein